MKIIQNICLLTLSATMISSGIIFAPPTQAQRVVNISPEAKTKNVSPDTSISGVFKDVNGVSVNLQSVKIYLDDKDITNSSTITKNFFSHKPSFPLAPGVHTVEVEYANVRGEEKLVSWTFSVQKPAAELEISSVSHNASEALGTGSTFLGTIKGTPRSKATLLLFQDGKKLQEIPTEEVSSGVYVGTYNVKAQDATDEGIVVGRIAKQGQNIYDAAPDGFIFESKQVADEAPPVQESNRSLRPLFVNYKNGDRVAGDIVLKGRTKPNATVQIEVSSTLPVLGGFISLDFSDDPFFRKKVKADRDGNFEVTVPGQGNARSGTQYNVKAIASNENISSRPVRLTLIQQ